MKVAKNRRKNQATENMCLRSWILIEVKWEFTLFQKSRFCPIFDYLLGWLTFYRLGWAEFYRYQTFNLGYDKIYFLDINWTINIVCKFIYKAKSVRFRFLPLLFSFWCVWCERMLLRHQAEEKREVTRRRSSGSSETSIILEVILLSLLLLWIFIHHVWLRFTAF